MELDDLLNLYFTTTDIASMFHCNKGTVRYWVRTGKVEAVRVFDRFMIQGKDLYNMLLCGSKYLCVNDAMEDKPWVKKMTDYFYSTVASFVERTGKLVTEEDINKPRVLSAGSKYYVKASNLPSGGVPFFQTSRFECLIYPDGTVIRRTRSSGECRKMVQKGDLLRIGNCVGGKTNVYYFSRAKLVLENFTKEKPKNYVLFKDGNPYNYNVDNLMYSDYYFSYKKARDKKCAYGKEERPVTLTHILNGSVLEFNCVKDAADFLETGVGNVCNCCRGKIKTVKGYVAAYKDNID